MKVKKKLILPILIKNFQTNYRSQKRDGKFQKKYFFLKFEY